MFTKIKEFFLGKPAVEVQAPYKIEAPQETHVEVAPAAAPVVAKPAVIKAAPKPKQPAAKKPAARKSAAKKPV